MPGQLNLPPGFCALAVCTLCSSPLLIAVTPVMDAPNGPEPTGILFRHLLTDSDDAESPPPPTRCSVISSLVQFVISDNHNVSLILSLCHYSLTHFCLSPPHYCSLRGVFCNLLSSLHYCSLFSHSGNYLHHLSTISLCAVNLKVY